MRRNAGNPELVFSRHEALTEMTDAVGVVFLGLTVGCARCPDHKFDDFSLADYYRLQAFLAATQERDVVLAPTAEQARWKVLTDRVRSRLARLQKALPNLEGDERVKAARSLGLFGTKAKAAVPALAEVVRNDTSGTVRYHYRKALGGDLPNGLERWLPLLQGSGDAAASLGLKP